MRKMKVNKPQLVDLAMVAAGTGAARYARPHITKVPVVGAYPDPVLILLGAAMAAFGGKKLAAVGNGIAAAGVYNLVGGLPGLADAELAAAVYDDGSGRYIPGADGSVMELADGTESLELESVL